MDERAQARPRSEEDVVLNSVPKHKVRVDDMMHRRINAEILQKFPERQNYALDYMWKRFPMHGTMASYDRINSAKKLVKGFYAVGWLKFFKWYRTLAKDQRIMYENVMPGTKEKKIEGHDIPLDKQKSDQVLSDWPDDDIERQGLCHFYGDIDVMMANNPGVDIEGRYKAFMEELIEFYKTYLGEPNPIVRMADSSGMTANGRKFSRHFLIKSSQGRMFANAAHCGAFYRCFAFAMMVKYGSFDTNPFCFMNDKNEKRELMLDSNVYTKYRGFRLLYSSKIKKNRWMIPDKEWMPDAHDVEDLSFEQFLDSLVQYSPDEFVEVLTATEPDGTEPLWTSGKLENLVEWKDGVARWIGKNKQKSSILNSNPNIKYSTKLDGIQWNPSIEHDRTMKNLGRRVPAESPKQYIVEAAQKAVQSWCVSETVNDLYVLPGGTAFCCASNRHGESNCPHINRPHTSNRTKYMLSLVDKDGIFEVSSYVSCMDSECPNEFVARKVWDAADMGVNLYTKLKEYVDNKWAETNVSDSEIAILYG